MSPLGSLYLWVLWGYSFCYYELTNKNKSTFLAATKQLNDWFSPSVCLSVTPFLTMFPSSYHHEIFRSCYQWQMWRPCKSSRSGVVIHSILKLFTFCKTLLKIQVFVQKVFFFNEQKIICKLKSWTWDAIIRVIPWIGHRSHMLNKFRILFSIHRCPYI